MSQIDDLISLVLATRRMIRHSVFRGGSLNVLSFEALGYLSENEDAAMSQMAAYLSLAAPAATVIASHLVKSGLAARHPDTADRRTIHLSITPRGRRVYGEHLKKNREAFRSHLGSLDERELGQLTRLMKKIAIAVQTGK